MFGRVGAEHKKACYRRLRQFVLDCKRVQCEIRPIVIGLANQKPELVSADSWLADWRRVPC